MCAALSVAHKGWGESAIIRVAGASEEIATWSLTALSGQVLGGSAFGDVKNVCESQN